MLENANDVPLSGAACLIHLPKCFDTISHDILWYKLYKCGISDILNINGLTHTCQIGLRQIVKVDEKLSSELPIKVGVPERSTCGPILILNFL